MTGMVLCSSAALVLFLAIAQKPAHAQNIPPCRLDNSMVTLVADTIERAASAYRENGKEFLFDSVVVNKPAPPDRRALVVNIIKDANAGDLTPQGCARGAAKKDEPLDHLSVRGGCVVVAVERMEMRCSSSAVVLFGDVGTRSGRANPALLYVLAHELAHLYQRRLGEYSGRAERLDLAKSRPDKLKELQAACDPVSTKREEEADAMAVKVLETLLAKPPYREPLYSQQGSLYWNIDQLALASDAWTKAMSEREFISRPDVHKSFMPTEFPTPAKVVESNARRFVCDVLTRTHGSIYYPGRSTTHPPLEQRLRRMAESLQPTAQALPNDSNQRQFKSIARLQSQLSPLFTHMYRETGVYMEAVQSRVCTIVNSPTSPVCK